jgi:hypothetical protein
MHAQPHRYSFTTSRHTQGLIAVTLTAALFALLAAIPTGWARAASPTPSVTTIPVVEALTPTELDEVLATLPVGALNTTELNELLEKLPGIKGLVPSLGLGGLANLQTALSAAITDQVNKGDTLGQLLEPTGLPAMLGTELGKLLPLLSTLLGGNPTTKLTEALGAQTPSELVDSLLSANPSQLLSELATGLTPANLEALLQSLLGTKMQTGFAPTTVEGAAEALGASTESLTTALDLPATTKALTAPLENGKTLSLLGGLGGLSLKLLSGSESPGSGGSGSGGSGGSSSGSGDSSSGEGPSGSNTPPVNAGTTTVLVSVPPTQTAVQPATASASSAGKGGIKILSHRVRGKVLTLVVQVPAAGKIALGGAGVRSLRHEAAKAGRITLRTTLTRAGTASLRKLHNHLKVTVKASFKQTGGPSSSAKTTIVFA